MAWWDLPVTQRFGVNGERGTDYGTPFGTALTLPFGGVVTGAGYHPWGGQVDIATTLPSGQHVTETLLHLDTIGVVPGQAVHAGQSVGYSGGQLAGGTHPAGSAYSSGPHTEIDFFTGKPFASNSIDPQPILARYGSSARYGATAASLSAGSGGAPSSDLVSLSVPGASVHIGNPLDPFVGPLNALTSAANQTAQAANALTNWPTTIGHGLADAFVAGETNVGTWFRRQAIAMAVAAVVLVVLFSEDKPS